jgi:hypothetical protein
MTTQTRREIRFGLVTLVLSGLLLTLGTALRGPIDLADLGSLIRAAASPNYVTALIIVLFGGVLQVFGAFGLYRYLTYQAESLTALLAFVLRITSLALLLPLITFLAVSVPVIADLYQQGNQEILAVVEANLTSGLGLILLAIGGVTGLPGMILFAIAIWRDGRLAKWTAIVFALGFILVAAAVTFATEFLGWVLLLISTGVIAWKGWQESAVRAGQ